VNVHVRRFLRTMCVGAAVAALNPQPPWIAGFVTMMLLFALLLTEDAS
jgi:hypothetical protein